MENSDRSLRVGIISHYYHSKNYGGNLQAYALCRVLNTLGCEAEQIAYDRGKDPSFWESDISWRRYFNLKRLQDLPKRLRIKLVSLCGKRNIDADLQRRWAAIQEFNQERILHSGTVYTCDTIASCRDEYDLFITGSDQVWHPFAVCEAYLLDFVDGKAKYKISYAASTAVDWLRDDQLRRYQESLADYRAVSVREKNMVSQIQSVTELTVRQVLDPTLLLDVSQWDEIVPERQIQENYIFCYFLGEDKNSRRVAAKYAQMRHLKVVTLPHLLGRYSLCDADFGDERLYAVSPEELLSLIKYADCIFTDSFHGTVFSLLYKKEFIVFERDFKMSMGSRLRSLTQLFDVEDHFCDTVEKMSLEHISRIGKIDYNKKFDKFEEMRTASLDFLKDNLKMAAKETEHS